MLLSSSYEKSMKSTLKMNTFIETQTTNLFLKTNKNLLKSTRLKLIVE